MDIRREYRTVCEIKAYIRRYIDKPYSDIDDLVEDVIVGVVDYMNENKEVKIGKSKTYRF